MTEVSAQSGYTPTQRIEQSRQQDLGSGGRAAEVATSGIKNMRAEVAQTAKTDPAKARRLIKNLHQAEKNLGR